MTTTMRHTAQLDDIDRILGGRALRPGDPDYDAAVGPTAIAAGKRPELVVRAADSVDVTLVVELARSADLELAVRIEIANEAAVDLAAGELHVVRSGLRHRSVARRGPAHALLIERPSTKGYGKEARR